MPAIRPRTPSPSSTMQQRSPELDSPTDLATDIAEIRDRLRQVEFKLQMIQCEPTTAPGRSVKEPPKTLEEWKRACLETEHLVIYYKKKSETIESRVEKKWMEKWINKLAAKR